MLATMGGEHQCSVLGRKCWKGLLSERHRATAIPKLIEAEALREMGRGDLPVQVHEYFAVGGEELAFAVGTQARFLLFGTELGRGFIPQSREYFARRREAGAMDQDVEI